MILLLYGSNRLAIDERVRALRRERDPSGFNTTVIESAGRQIDLLLAACGSVGFFGAGRLVIAHDLLAERSGVRRGKRPSAPVAGPESVFRELPPDTILVLVEQSVDGEGERSLRRLNAEITVERHDVPRDMELVQWAAARARGYDASLDGGAAQALVEALFPGTWRRTRNRDDVPPNLYQLDAEIAKLAIAAGREGQIDGRLIAQLVHGAEAPNLWGLTDAIGRGDGRAALREVIRSLDDGAAPEMLIGQLAGQFEALALLAALPQGANPADAARSTGLSESRVRGLRPLLPRFSRPRIAAALDALRELDASGKTGLVEPADALLAVVARVAAP